MPKVTFGRKGNDGAGAGSIAASTSWGGCSPALPAFDCFGCCLGRTRRRCPWTQQAWYVLGGKGIPCATVWSYLNYGASHTMRRYTPRNRRVRDWRSSRAFDRIRRRTVSTRHFALTSPHFPRLLHRSWPNAFWNSSTEEACGAGGLSHGGGDAGSKTSRSSRAGFERGRHGRWHNRASLVSTKVETA